ncbi:hypothetical protein F7018_11575 [Tenacibaculum aiptasiae]|uniref:Uncharacterized protein n=1 Tax=Tenacibaculum aiptasiae TaxID=426481 RepID=A0A7J5AEE6_9FLAO|nr:hypothetical protein [Tenacibaculum aiptasiae]KAB1155942.1 hypothetical protein F7018_11575 [Tenacibaculum aiptasiae]
MKDDKKIDENIIGFFASFDIGDNDKELVKNYLWGDNGLKNKLAHLKWNNYGHGLEIILFKVYVKPIPYLRKNLRGIENYKPKEKSIAVPIILDRDNFFKLSETDQQLFFTETIVEKLGLVKSKVKRNKLNFNISLLITDVKTSLNYKELEKKSATNNVYNSLWQRIIEKFNL